MDSSFRDVGARIQAARKSRHISQLALADALGISTSHMSDIETGKSNFGVDILMRITEVLQVSADDLLRTNIPSADAIYESEIAGILDGCTPTEKSAILDTITNMKKAFAAAHT